MLYKLCCEGVGFVDGSLLNVFSAAVATNSAFALKCRKDAPSLMEKQFDSSEAETATLIINQINIRPLLRCENGGRKILLNVCKFLSDYTASHTIK